MTVSRTTRTGSYGSRITSMFVTLVAGFFLVACALFSGLVYHETRAARWEAEAKRYEQELKATICSEWGLVLQPTPHKPNEPMQCTRKLKLNVPNDKTLRSDI